NADCGLSIGEGNNSSTRNPQCSIVYPKSDKPQGCQRFAVHYRQSPSSRVGSRLTWCTVVWMRQVEFLGVLTDRWDHFLRHQAYAGQPRGIAHWSLNVEEGKDTGS